MAPKQSILHEACDVINCKKSTTSLQNDSTTPAVQKKWELAWDRIIYMIVLHVATVYSIYLALFKAMWTTYIYTFIISYFMGFGITAGAHRLWSHKCYKAKLPLQIFLLSMQTMCLQDSMYMWVRDHRMHHKYAETDADPHNSTRGFFFAHIGWLFLKKHPEYNAKLHTIDMTDIKYDPLLRFQARYYFLLAPLACFIIPAYFPTLWGESAWNAFFGVSILRYVILLHSSFLVNSVAHLWGENKPYDKNIAPVDGKALSVLTIGEGFHNYHHTFPWDYKAAELGNYSVNMTTMFIDFMAKIGWAYDLKTVSDDVIAKRAQRTGDGSHKPLHDY